MEAIPLVDQIDALLPQTQCRQCGFPGCKPYAEAIAKGEADINQCPPGGEAGVEALAALLGRKPKPLDPERGPTLPKSVAVIDEQRCIGCALCIQACPVDAILGAAKLMHTVIAAECTGCRLCLPPCPVDCIAMVPVAETLAEGDSTATARARRQADHARLRHEARLKRKARDNLEKAENVRRKKESLEKWLGLKP
ncbi:MAG: electron transport complex subunit RsxB [Candidatus Methylumidiphilus sp.]